MGEQVGEEKAAVVPVGSPEAEKETACAVPETRVAVMVLRAEAPWVVDWLPPLAREKLKATDVLANSYPPMS